MTHSLELSWRPGIVIAAFFASAIGCFSALQITKHRTGRWGWRNWKYLFLSGLSLGWCGVWNAVRVSSSFHGSVRYARCVH